MYGLTHLSATYPTPKNFSPTAGKPGGKIPKPAPIHFIGKDNIVFHCIVFPAMLKAEGSYILPDNVPSNEFLNLEGDKNLHFPQLGCMVARIPGGLPRQTGRTPLRTDRQRTGNKRQRLHLERLPGTQ